MNLRNNLFGSGPRSSRDQPPAGYGRAPAPPPREDTAMGGYDGNGYAGRQEKSPMTSPRQAMPMRQPVGGRGPMSPRRAQLSIAKVEDKTKANQYIFGNL